MDEITRLELSQFLRAARGRAAELARRCKVQPPVVHDWTTGLRPVPAAHCPTVEEFTGIACERLQPAVRWHVLRGTAVPMGTTPAVEVLALHDAPPANDEPSRDARA